MVIIIDHAENFSFSDYIPHLKSLRELRRDKISLLFAASKTLDLEKFGFLRSVILENEIFLGPLSEDDCRAFVSRLEKIYEVKIDPKTVKKIFALSGGAMRLIKRLVKLTADNLSYEGDPKLEVDLKAINEFFKEYPRYKFPLPLLENISGAADKIGDISFTERLSKQEYDLAQNLILKKNQFVSREEMIEAVWKNQKYDVNEHALDQMLHRLRKKMETARPKHQLETFRGRGVKLIALFQDQSPHPPTGRLFLIYRPRGACGPGSKHREA